MPAVSTDIAVLSATRINLTVSFIGFLDEAAVSAKELEVAQSVSSVVLGAADDVARAARQVEKLAARQSAREMMAAVEEVEHSVSAQRAAVEQRAVEAAAVAAEAEMAATTWQTASKLAARNAASRLDESPQRKAAGASVLLATSMAAETQLADATLAAAAAAEAEAAAAMAALATPWSNGFALVSERGWTGWDEAVYSIQRFGREVDARKAATPLWCCWVLFKETDACSYQELTSGGVGFAKPAIRRWVREKLEKPKQAARKAARGESPTPLALPSAG